MMMNKKIIFQKIGGILSEINEQYQYLSGNMENINDLELELFVANANFLSEHATILKRINEAQVPVQETTALNQVEQKETISAAPVLETIQTKPSWENTTIISPEPVLETESVSIAQDKIEEQVTPVPVYVEPANSVKPTEIVSETFSKPFAPAEPVIEVQSVKNNPTPTLNDILSEKASQNNIARQYHAQTSDLKAMVSLNDKLLFVKDLFNGYSLAYSEAIDLANRCTSYEDAIAFLQANYGGKNKWADKQKAVDKLHEILSRRFSK